MAELTMGTLIKIILGVLVVVIVIIAIGVFFGGKVVSFFKNLFETEPETAKAVLSLLK